MKTYSYKSPIINLITAVGLLLLACVFVAMVFSSFPDEDFFIKIFIRIFCGFFSLLLFSLGGVIGYIFITNIKPEKIVLEEDKILIPNKFNSKIKPTVFHYSEIKVLKIVTSPRHRQNPIYSPYGGAIYIATGETGYIREVEIEKNWMKNKSEYLELFEFLKDKIR